MSAVPSMSQRRPLLIEALTAAGLLAAPFILPHLGFSPTTINRILVWGLFGIGFDILFGFTGLLSFGQSAFYGTGGFVAAYLLTILNFPSVIAALFIGMIAAAIVGYLVGLIALRRTGIYFAMITVAIAEVFYFVEFNPLSAYTGGENGLPGVPDADALAGLHHHQVRHRLVALCVSRLLVFRRHRDRAAHRAFAAWGDPARDTRQSSARRCRRPQHPRLQARGIRDRGGLCGICRRAARRVAGFHATGCLYLRHVGAIGDANRHRRRRHAVRPARRCDRLALSQRFLSDHAPPRCDLEARARHRLRAAGVLPASRHRRRARRSRHHARRARPVPRTANRNRRRLPQATGRRSCRYLHGTAARAARPSCGRKD